MALARGVTTACARTSLRRVRLWMAALYCAAVLTVGCDQGSEKASQPVTLVLKHSKLFGEPAPLDALVAQFERENPGVAVRRETLPSASDEQHQFYAINLQAQSTDFDVFALDVIWVAEFARAGWLRDLSHLLPLEARHDFFSGPMQAVTYENRIYALPWFIDAGLLYYRKDLLAAHSLSPPRTWEELIQAAAIITSREPELYGFIWQGKQYEGLVCNALEHLWSNGGEVLREGRLVLDSAQNRAALGFMHALIADHGVSPPFVTTLTEEPAREIFGRGKAVFLRNWPYAWRLFERPGSPVQGTVGISVLPHFAGGASAATLGGWQLGVNRYSRHPAEAERLAHFLTSAEAHKALALAYGLSPPRRSLYRDAGLVAAQPFLTELYAVFEHARPRPVSASYIAISQVLQAEFSAAVTGIKSPQAALASGQRQIERILQR